MILGLAAAFVILYIGGWRITLFDGHTDEKIVFAWERSFIEKGTRITSSVVMNPDLQVYIYKSGDGRFAGVYNIYKPRWGYASVILAILAVAWPFGILVF